MWTSRGSPSCNQAVGTPDHFPTSVGDFQVDENIDVRQVLHTNPRLTQIVDPGTHFTQIDD